MGCSAGRAPPRAWGAERGGRVDWGSSVHFQQRQATMVASYANPTGGRGGTPQPQLPDGGGWGAAHVAPVEEGCGGEEEAHEALLVRLLPLRNQRRHLDRRRGGGVAERMGCT